MSQRPSRSYEVATTRTDYLLMTMIRKGAGIGVFATWLCASVNATEWDDDVDDEGGADYKYAIGLMVTVEKSLYVGGKGNIQIEPGVMAEWGRVYLRGSELGVDLYQGNYWSISSEIALDFTGDTERGDSLLLADMGELDDVLLGQIRFAYTQDWGELALTLRSDVSDKHGGYMSGLFYGYLFELDRWFIEPEVELVWNSARVFQYYYGVGVFDALPSRPLYTPESGTVSELSVAATYHYRSITHFDSNLKSSSFLVKSPEAQLSIEIESWR